MQTHNNIVHLIYIMESTSQHGALYQFFYQKTYQNYSPIQYPAEMENLGELLILLE